MCVLWSLVESASTASVHWTVAANDTSNATVGNTFRPEVAQSQGSTSVSVGIIGQKHSRANTA